MGISPRRQLGAKESTVQNTVGGRQVGGETHRHVMEWPLTEERNMPLGNEPKGREQLKCRPSRRVTYGVRTESVHTQRVCTLNPLERFQDHPRGRCRISDTKYQESANPC